MPSTQIAQFFDTAGLMPQGLCPLWRPSLLWLHLIAGGVIAASYCAISLALLRVARRRRDLAFSGPLTLFSAFLFLCGTAQVMESWTLWHPDYVLSGLVKAAAAVVSLAAAAALWRLMPKALALPGPAKLGQLDAALQSQITERSTAEAAMRRLNTDLERHVAERTAELAAANATLRAEIEERRRAENRLRESEDRYHQVVDLMEEGVWIHADNKILFANMRAARLLGHRDPDSLVGLAPADLLAPEFRSAVTAQSGLLVDSAARIPMTEVDLLRRDGSRVTAEIQAVPFIYDHRVVVMTAARDITRRKELEAQLIQSQKMEAIGQLTGGVAHDFNNLLTVILGNSEALSDRLAQEGQSRFLADVIGAAAIKGAELTQHLLAFARQQPLQPKAVDVNRLMTGMSGLLRVTAGETISPIFIGQDGLWAAMIDAQQLESTILNLALNARDAMPSGGSLTIETANVTLDVLNAHPVEGVTPGQYVVVTVSDTGTGMTEAVRARAFDPFFTTKEVGKGTGLGLSMVFGFVKQSGGHVQIDSRLGAGTTVRLYLPRAAAEAAPQPAAPPETAGAGQQETILVVEDDDLVLAYVSLQIEGFGYKVITVKNGHEALEVLKGDVPIDLLFTDIVMPGGMDGKALAVEAERVRPGLRVLFTSGYSENALTHEGRLDPGIQLISKPYRRRELARKLCEVLGKKEGNRAVS